jgi:hypothetical protein
MDATRDIQTVMREQVKPAGENRYGLVVGIERYRDSRLNLRCARRDAEAIHKLMIDPECGLFPPENVELLVDEQATTPQVFRALAKLRRSAGPDDTVWIFFAGHAAPEGKNVYWVTHDADVDNLYATALGNDRITQVLNEIPARRLMIFLDCCHAAATAIQQNPTRATLTPADVFAGYEGKGRMTLASSDGKEKSVELSEYGHGAFTYFLQQGLRGEADENGDGVVTADELWHYLHNKVAQAARQAGNPQTPVLQGELTHNLPLTLNPRAMERKRRLEDVIRSHVGLDEKQNLTTDEGRWCRELIHHGPQNEDEWPVYDELERLVDGQARIPTIKRLIAIAQRTTAPQVPQAPVDTPISRACPACGKFLKIRANHAGQNVQCPGCKSQLHIADDRSTLSLPQPPAPKVPLAQPAEAARQDAPAPQAMISPPRIQPNAPVAEQSPARPAISPSAKPVKRPTNQATFLIVTLAAGLGLLSLAMLGFSIWAAIMAEQNRHAAAAATEQLHLWVRIVSIPYFVLALTTGVLTAKAAVFRWWSIAVVIGSAGMTVWSCLLNGHHITFDEVWPAWFAASLAIGALCVVVVKRGSRDIFARIHPSKMTVAIAVLIFVAVGVIGFLGYDLWSSFAGSKGTFSGDEDGAQGRLAEFLKPGANRQALTNSLRPTAIDYRTVFKPGYAAEADRFYNNIWDAPHKFVLDPQLDQTEIVLSLTPPEDLANPQIITNGNEALVIGRSANTLPAASSTDKLKLIFGQLADNVDWYEFQFVKPGTSKGYGFRGLAYVNGQWRLFPMRPLKDLENQSSSSSGAQASGTGTRNPADSSDPFAPRPASLPLHIFNAEAGAITAVAFSPDGRKILTGHDDNSGPNNAKFRNTTTLWDVATGSRLWTTLNLDTTIWDVAFLNAEFVITATSNGTVVLWDADTGKLVESVTDVLTSRSGVMPLYVPGRFGLINKSSLKFGGEKLILRHDKDAYVRLDPITATLIVSHDYGNGAVWQPNGQRHSWNKSESPEFNLGDAHYFFVNASFDKAIKVGSSLRMLDLKAGSELWRIYDESLHPTTAAFSPGGDTVVVALKENNTAALLDAATGGKIGVFEGHSGEVTGVAFSPDGTRVLTGSADETAILWGADTGKKLQTLSEHKSGVVCVAFSPDGKQAITGMQDGTAVLWKLVAPPAGAPRKPRNRTAPVRERVDVPVAKTPPKKQETSAGAPSILKELDEEQAQIEAELRAKMRGRAANSDKKDSNDKDSHNKDQNKTPEPFEPVGTWRGNGFTFQITQEKIGTIRGVYSGNRVSGKVVGKLEGQKLLLHYYAARGGWRMEWTMIDRNSAHVRWQYETTPAGKWDGDYKVSRVTEAGRR